MLGSLVEKYPDLRSQIYSEQGKLRNFVNVYLNDEDVRYLQKGATPVSEGDTISIIPAIAGGRSELAEAAGAPVTRLRWRTTGMTRRCRTTRSGATAAT